MAQRFKKKWKIGLIITLTVLLVLTGVFFGYVADYYEADEIAYALLDNTEEVQYLGGAPLHFAPTEASNIGIIFYPGGKVDEVAYTPLMQPLAEAGYNTFIAKMPFHLAVFDIDAADEIIADHPEIKYWFVGGHSLGAAMSASYVADNLDQIEGLILLAGYSTADLSEANLPVLALYGSEDEVIDVESVVDYRFNLPDEAIEATLAGGNHAQFGAYGEQAGDGVALISPEEQHEMIVEAIQTFIGNIDLGN